MFSLLWFTMRHLKIECKPGNEHITLKSDFVHTGWRQGDGQADETHDGWSAFLLAKRVLGTKFAQQEHNLRQVVILNDNANEV